MFRLIATDLDGTLFGPDLAVSDRATRAFRRAQAAGLKIVIATGRMFRSALPYAATLDVSDPLITYQGAWIRHPHTLETLWHHPLDQAVALDTIALVRGAGLHLNLYRDDTLHVEAITPECEWYCEQARIEATVVPSLEEISDRVTKLVAIARPEVLDEHAERLKAALGARCYVVRSTPRYLEFAAPGITKGVALAELAQRLGILPEEVVAFGDADNDAEMLAWAGLGVSVGSASSAARKAAKRHEDRVGDGVASVLDELFS